MLLMWVFNTASSVSKDLRLAAKAHTAALSCRGRKVIKRQPLAIEDAAVGGVPTHCFASRANRSSRSLAVSRRVACSLARIFGSRFHAFLFPLKRAFSALVLRW